MWLLATIQLTAESVENPGVHLVILLEGRQVARRITGHPRARRRSLGAGTGLARATRFGLVRRPRRTISGVVALSEAPPALSLSPRTAVLGSGGERPGGSAGQCVGTGTAGAQTLRLGGLAPDEAELLRAGALAHIFVRQVGVWCSHTGRDAGAEGGTHDPVFEDVCGFWLGNGHCDRTVLGRRIAGAYQCQHVCSGSDRSGSNDP